MSQLFFTELKYGISFVVILICIAIVSDRVGNVLNEHLLINIPEGLLCIISNVLIIALFTRGLLMTWILQLIQSGPGGGGGGGSGIAEIWLGNKDIFVLFYLCTPLVLSISMLILGINDFTMAIFKIAKGVFYACLVSISALEYVYLGNDKLGKLALGFSLSLAIFEAFTALFEGFKSIIIEYDKEKKPCVEAEEQEKLSELTTYLIPLGVVICFIILFFIIYYSVSN